MNNRVVIALLVLALVAMPCAKLASIYGEVSALAKEATTATLEADLAAEGAAASLDTFVAEGDDSKPVCRKSCRQWQGVVPRFDDVVPPGAQTQVTVAALPYDVAWTAESRARSGIGARSPPTPTGPAFDLHFARTSRFLS